jgi:hypothetical protein
MLILDFFLSSFSFRLFGSSARQSPIQTLMQDPIQHVQMDASNNLFGYLYLISQDLLDTCLVESARIGLCIEDYLYNSNNLYISNKFVTTVYISLASCNSIKNPQQLEVTKIEVSLTEIVVTTTVKLYSTISLTIVPAWQR